MSAIPSGRDVQPSRSIEETTEPALAGAVTIIPIPSAHRFGVGDDIVDELATALSTATQQLRDGDIVCVVSKVVSLSEGQLVAIAGDDARQSRRDLARSQASMIVADTPGVLVTRTPHGFVLANGGIDASNVDDGHALLLPVDADQSAHRLRRVIAEHLGVNVAVVITDSFGRPWRHGQLDTAIGAAGLATLRDERGGTDLDGRPLEVTMAALVDAVAAASDLVRSKASGTPFVILRGLAPQVAGRSGQPDGVVATIVRPIEEDLFAHGGPTAADHAIRARRTVRSYDATAAVPDDAIAAAIAAAVTAPAPHHTKPWRFVRLDGDVRSDLLDAMEQQWRRDLSDDGVEQAAIERRISRSDELLRTAPVLLAAFVALDGAQKYSDIRRSQAERDLFVLSAGAALANAQIALAARGLGAAWLSTTAFCPQVSRRVLDLPESWQSVGMLTIGWPAGPAQPREPVDISEFLANP
ncbi:MAG: coenzyme F420-0:L-glutamate ligase [Nitriliruptoraceae bacterium]